MKVGLIHNTEDYHKLVEMTARECYQSYHKLGEDSHSFIKGIMAAGHISIASTGNIVYGIAGFNGLEEYAHTMSDLMTMKEINNYIRWTQPDPKNNPDSKIGVIVSMNLLTFLDINNKIEDYDISTSLWESFKRLFIRVPEMKWFLNDKTKVKPKENPYTAKGEPELYNPVILTEDYTALKEKGLTDYELDVHATITMNLKVDRSTGLQIWRHADMTGGTELSQRYVERGKAGYRKLLEFEDAFDEDKLEKYVDSLSEGLGDIGNVPSAKVLVENVIDDFYNDLNDGIDAYNHYKELFSEMGMRKSRAKEVARALLPNAMTTKIINCRPLRQWKHFINLRDTPHAQKEIHADTQSIKKAFEEVGIPYE